MERTLYSSTKLQIDIVLIPAIGFAVGYQRTYRELSLVFGCLLLTFEFHRTKIKKRK